MNEVKKEGLMGLRMKNTMTATKNSESGMVPTDIIKAINELKTDLKDNNNTLRQEITHFGQEINGKLDRLGAEVHNLSDRVEEAESRVETVERWAAEVYLCMFVCSTDRTQCCGCSINTAAHIRQGSVQTYVKLMQC